MTGPCPHRYVTEVRDMVMPLGRTTLGGPDATPTWVRVVRFCARPTCEAILYRERA